MCAWSSERVVGASPSATSWSMIREPGMQHLPSFIPAAVVVKHSCSFQAQGSKTNQSHLMEPAGSLLNPWKDFT